MICNMQLAVHRTVADDRRKAFLGAHGNIRLYKPDNVGSTQWSTARIKLINGYDSLEAGWMVNHDEFGDYEPHFYVGFTAGLEGCSSLDCPGFIQVSTEYPLGMTPQRYSTVNKHFAWILSIDKEPKHKIGYWPESLFTSLKDVANQVEFGGEINSPKAVHPAPSMGNGLKPDPDNQRAACITHITIVNKSSKNIDLLDTENFNDCDLYYTVRDYGNHDELGRIICYGGPRSE
ncbi:hypothetical protein vseg_008625 [Gypsophila vaccaria]